jgi:predicted metal-dependent hydrolase
MLNDETATVTVKTDPLTIAQALRRIKKLKGRMGELTTRAAASVSYQSDQKPAFDFAATRTEVETTREVLIVIEAAVAKANALATVNFDSRAMTLAEAIRRLQEFKAEMAWLGGLTLRSGIERRREPDYDQETGRTKVTVVTITFTSDLSEVQRAAELDKLRDRFERLNDLVEAANHRTATDWRGSAEA